MCREDAICTSLDVHVFVRIHWEFHWRADGKGSGARGQDVRLALRSVGSVGAGGITVTQPTG